MKKFIPVILGCAVSVASFTSVFADTTLETKKDKVSYSIGLNIGKQMSVLKDNIDVNKVILGIKDGQAGAESKMTEAEIKNVMTAFQAEIQAKQKTEALMVASINKEEAKTFLAENKEKEGVITLESGVQYKVLAKGEGPSPKITDTVTVHYKGSLINGKEFDSSIKRGEPATFPLDGVIKGWGEALQKMKVGSKWQLFIPADSAYGSQGAAGVIGPNTMLIFEVELLEIKSAPQAKTLEAPKK